ncbi:MAG: glycosyltransferase [Polyangiaceae bacterium]
MTTFVVTTSYPASPGDPSGHFVRADARELVERGERVMVVCPSTAPDAPNPDVAETVPERAGAPEPEVIRIPGGRAFGWPGTMARVRANPWNASGLVTFVDGARRVLASRTREGDRVIGHWVVPSLIPIALGTTRGVAWEGVSHGADVRLLLALPMPLRVRVIRGLVRRTEAWRFVSGTLLDDLLRDLPARDAESLRAVAHVAPSALGDLRVARPREGGDYVAVGRLVASKRFDAVVRHVASRSASHRGNAAPRLIVVGDGPERGSLEALARSLGVDARFVGTLPRPEALGHMVAAKVLLHASRVEGASTVLREAESLGVHVEFVP